MLCCLISNEAYGLLVYAPFADVCHGLDVCNRLPVSVLVGSLCPLMEWVIFDGVTVSLAIIDEGVDTTVKAFSRKAKLVILHYDFVTSYNYNLINVLSLHNLVPLLPVVRRCSNCYLFKFYVAKISILFKSTK